MTYSIVAFDTSTKQFGIAVASCVPLDVVQQVPGIVLDRGAFVTQSFLFPDGWKRARDMLATGATAEQTLAALVDPTFDPSFETRQYAIIDIDGGTAVFTGKDDAVYNAAHRVGSFGPFVYTLQGNILAGDGTLANMEAGFVNDVCDLPERLVRTLETASFDRGGDNRCVLGEGRPAQSAVVVVPSAGLALQADPGEDSLVDPTMLIRAQFDRWREAHPCASSAGVTNTSDDGCRVTSSSPSFDVMLVVPLIVLVLRRARAAGRRVP